jgi:sulfur-oxidizing protein SoxY
MSRSDPGAFHDDASPSGATSARDPGARRHALGLLAALPLAASGLVPRAAWAATPPGERWQMLRPKLFGDKPIASAEGLIEVEAPPRAADAALVPIAIRSRVAQTPQLYVKRVHLIIDNNPSPAGAIFDFTPESGRAEVETRVRIEEYTPLRVVAEMSDGRLVMQERFVKASGGCSAPAGKDPAAARLDMGKIKWRLDGDAVVGKPMLVQLMVNHPNTSGLAIDQVTRIAPVPHYVRSVRVSHAGKPVFAADVDFTLSENPSLRFYFVPREVGELSVVVEDTEDREFKSAIAVPLRSTPAA